MKVHAGWAENGPGCWREDGGGGLEEEEGLAGASVVQFLDVLAWAL